MMIATNTRKRTPVPGDPDYVWPPYGSNTWGWHWQPGLYRCDRGWNAGGKSYGCKQPGQRHVGPEWLCGEHADEIPDPEETVYRCCDECRERNGLPERFGAPGQEYWCNGCKDYWVEDGKRPDPHRPTVGGFIFMGVWLTYLLGLFFALTGVAYIYLLPHFPSSEADEASFVAMLAALAAIIPWWIAVWVSGWLRNEIAWWSWVAWRSVWGEPCAK